MTQINQLRTFILYALRLSSPASLGNLLNYNMQFMFCEFPIKDNLCFNISILSPL